MEYENFDQQPSNDNDEVASDKPVNSQSDFTISDAQLRYKNLQELQDEINSRVIGELRVLARDEFGLVPGTQKRGELEKAIIEVYLGNRGPDTRKKQGRTPTGGAKPVADNVPPAITRTAPPMVAQTAATAENEVQAETTKTYDAPRQEQIATGILEIMADGFGFLRTNNYFSTPNKDIYVPPTQIKRFGLRNGDKIKCNTRTYSDRSAPSLIFIYEINDSSNLLNFRRVTFDSLTPCFPKTRLTLECDKLDYALRAIDLVAPIGKGQRGLIVAPPKTGKTILLKKIAQAIRKNHPEIYLTVLLIDERPEEVTDFKESVDCDVVYSTFDQSPTHHTQIAEFVIANAKRRVEQGQDVMILMDSITRLARAYNQTAEQSGRTMTGGLDISAMEEPKRLFGAGRNFQNGGSLTILATALIDTGSRMDDIIYEEFKGTGNMEIHLDRRMSERRIFPAIDLNRSGTRREELLLTMPQLEGMHLIRRTLSRGDTVQATEELLDMLTCTSNNTEFIDMLKVIMRKKM